MLLQHGKFSSTVKGITYSVINSSLPIKDVEQWKALMNEAINNQADTLSVTIVNFDQNVYDITTFRSYDVAISAKGSVTGTIANITYSFSYHSNYRMTRAYETGSKDKLNVEELAVYDKLVTKAQEIKSQYTSDFDKEKGISCLLINSPKGQELFELIENQIHFVPSQFAKVAKTNGQLKAPSVMPMERNNILDINRRNGYEGVERYFSRKYRYQILLYTGYD